MGRYVHFTEYSPEADIVVMAICLVMVVLVFFSFFSQTRSSRLFLVMVALIYASACVDVLFYTLAPVPAYRVLANWMRTVFHALLLLIFVYYIAYIHEVTHYEKERRFLLLANLLYVVFMAADIMITLKGPTFVAGESGIGFIRRGVFTYAYLTYTFLCVFLLARVRGLLFHRVMRGFYGTITVSLLIMLIQELCGHSSFTVSTFLFPVLGMMYVLHSNPYDALLGTNDAGAMEEYVRHCSVRHLEFIIMSLYLKEFDGDGMELPGSIQTNIRELVYRNARNARLFKVGRGHMVLIFRKNQYPDFENVIQSIITDFMPLYEQYHYDYKVVVSESVDEISRKNEYVGFIRSIHKSMPECCIRRVAPEDVAAFNSAEYIVRELADISRRGDLDDPRVLLFCQPVLNVRTGKYDTAEALMRLDLENLGIVYPGQFIPLAEEQNYIHVLTGIILHKACEAIRRFMDGGYEIRRISVNVSVSDLKDENFCGKVIEIIRKSGIPADRIAIELTESQNEGDFLLMKQRISELKEQGIRFYLDDFGTGYSSMERIMELPFDIIKFDRSLVIASGAEKRSRRMVSNLANMFSNMDYYVLYEGVEKDADEAMCKDMCATYLQGFKYSKPVPVSELEGYLSRADGSQCDGGGAVPAT